MNLDKLENPYTADKVDDESAGYPLMTSIQNRPTQSCLNASVDSQSDFSVYDPSEVQQQQPAAINISASGNVIQRQQPAFNPVKIQQKVKKCSKCMVIYSKISIAISMILIAWFTFRTLSSDGTVSWTDIDGQKMSVNVPSNWWFVIYFCILVLCGLGIKQSKIAIRLFKPILKEYKDAETGVTNGIVMNSRKSKKMLKFRKQMCKIIFAYFIFQFISMVYQCQISDNTTLQYIEQKYAYISKNNESYGLPYSVDKIINTGGEIEPGTVQPEVVKKVEEEIFNMTNQEKDEIEKWEQSSGERVPWHQIPIEGAPFRANSTQALWFHHHHQSQHHHSAHHKHHPQHQEEQEEPMEDEPVHKKKPKHHPYKEWLDKLPYMSKGEAFRQAQHYERNKIIGHSFFEMFLYAIFQFAFINCLNYIIKNQKILEEKYMGPEIKSVRNCVRQPRVVQQQQRVMIRQPDEPVIQYIMAPQVSQSGVMTSTNQMA